ncbi:hypothetical protein [Leucobacter rhizosphaerae]|nr:hypothetical protein [Leucobacter rhizosphaerae]
METSKRSLVWVGVFVAIAAGTIGTGVALTVVIPRTPGPRCWP